MKRYVALPLTFCLLATSAAAHAQRSPSPDDAMLARGNPGEWLTHGGNYAETRFSPLNQITRENVGRLGLAWSYDVPRSQGQLEATPLIHDGVMYATGTWSIVFALNARTGEEMWQWDPGIVRGGRAAGGPTICCGPVNRGVALFQGKVFAGLLDGRLVALDAESGEIVWTAQTTPLGGEFSITGAPRIVGGKVIIGNGGAEYHGVRGYLSAYDPDTGELIWRTYTVPGNPELGFESPAMERAAETWAGEWWIAGGGGTVWDSFAYDPEANLLYAGVGNGSPWSREHRSAGVGDNLYLASILALNPDNGEIVWHYQTVPGDDWDYTATQHIMLADLTIEGRERRVLMQAPKNGFFYVIDRLTGELISAEPFAHVTWATHVDMATGRPVETPIARYDTIGAYISPGPRGAHNWEPMSWNPSAGLVYIPGQNTVSFYRRNPDYEPRPGQFSTGIGGDRPRTVEAPEPPTPTAFLVAWDPVAQRERWRIPYTSSRNGGTLSTAGDLLFSGRYDGYFLAHDAHTGEPIWEFELAPGLASPVTYMLEGRQFLTVLAGPGGPMGPAARVYTFVLDGQAPAPTN
jgi:quinohemoprotein ethanol dehydrogenase